MREIDFGTSFTVFLDEAAYCDAPVPFDDAPFDAAPMEPEALEAVTGDVIPAAEVAALPRETNLDRDVRSLLRFWRSSVREYTAPTPANASRSMRSLRPPGGAA